MSGLLGGPPFITSQDLNSVANLGVSYQPNLGMSQQQQMGFGRRLLQNMQQPIIPGNILVTVVPPL
jgi:hypothetical protein